jgi:hypothetical protein
MRAFWIGTCAFWTSAWFCGALFWAWTLVGLLLFIPAGLSAWAVMIPIGKPTQPLYPQLPPGQFGPPPGIPPQY